MYTIRQVSISMFVSLIVLSVLLLNASLISMDGGQDSGNQQDQQDLVAGSQYDYPFAQPGYVDGQLRDPYIFISSVAKRLNNMDKYIETSLSVLTEDEHDDSIKARLKTIMSVTRLARLDIGKIQSDIKNFFELIKSGEDSEEKCKFVDSPGTWYGSNLTSKQQSEVAEKPSSATNPTEEANSTEAKNPVTPPGTAKPASHATTLQQPVQQPASRVSTEAQHNNGRYVTRGAVTHDTWKCSCETCTRTRGGSAPRGNYGGHCCRRHRHRR